MNALTKTESGALALSEPELLQVESVAVELPMEFDA